MTVLRPTTWSHISGVALAGAGNMLADDGALATGTLGYPGFASYYEFGGFAAPPAGAVLGVALCTRGSGAGIQVAAPYVRVNGVLVGATGALNYGAGSTLTSFDLTAMRAWTAADFALLTAEIVWTNAGSLAVDAVWLEVTQAEVVAPPPAPPVYRDVGHIPAFSAAAILQTIQHVSTRYGAAVVDEIMSPRRQVEFALSSDEINLETMQALLSGGAATEVAQDATPQTVTITAAARGRWCELGSVHVQVTQVTHGPGDGAGEPVSDYSVEEDMGLVRINAALPAGDNVQVTFERAAVTGLSFDPLAAPVEIQGNALVLVKGFDGRMLAWRPWSASLVYAGSVAVSGQAFVRVAATLQVRPVRKSGQSPWGRFDLVPAAPSAAPGQLLAGGARVLWQMEAA